MKTTTPDLDAQIDEAVQEMRRLETECRTFLRQSTDAASYTFEERKRWRREWVVSLAALNDADMRRLRLLALRRDQRERDGLCVVCGGEPARGRYRP